MDVGTLRTHVTSGPTAGANCRSLGVATRRKTVTRGAGCSSRARPDLRGERWGRSMVTSKRARRRKRRTRPRGSLLVAHQRPIPTADYPGLGVNFGVRQAKPGRGGSHVGSLQAETFRKSPAGGQSRLAKEAQQPEPSVARVTGNREREAYTGSEQAASLSLESDASWVPTLFQ